jgi:hypothetical protein
VACATGAAVIVAAFLVKAALPIIPWPAVREPSLFGFAVGAFSWELLPLVFSIVKRRAAERAETLSAPKRKSPRRAGPARAQGLGKEI